MSLWGNTDTANNKPKFANTADVSGVTIAEAQANTGIAHPGWVKTTVGTGPVTAIAVTAGGTGYSNGAALTISGGGGSGAAGTIVVSGGAITGVVITAGGSGYTSAPTVTAPTGTGATFSVTLGGRAGRSFKETLVALASMSN